MLPLNPWISIWVHPRKTIQQIIAYNPNFRLWVLASVFGFSCLMFLEQLFAPGLKYSLKAILLFTGILAPFFGYFGLSFLSFLTYRVGKVMGGKGNFSDIRAALSWAFVPYFVIAFSWIILLAIFQADLFKDFPRSIALKEWQIGVVLAISLLKVLISIWSFIIYIQTLAFVQKFTTKKTILNVIFVGVIISIIIFLLWTVLVNTCGHFFDVPLITFRF